jgi:predicted AlkP superfamily pyrophosphatase or phosphodiesterase
VIPSKRVAALLVAAAVLFAACQSSAEKDGPRATGDGSPRDRSAQRIFETKDPLKRACALPKRYLLRLWRGYHPVHSEDVTFVPQEPNFAGTFNVTSHSGPWDYLQQVPLVLYGPGFVPEAGNIERPVTLADIYDTVGRLMQPARVSLEPRRGSALTEALESDRQTAPRLVVQVVWDGVGANSLNRWDDRWPVLRRLMSAGTSYERAVVGSSPSITPAAHGTMATGAFPNEHGVTSIDYRTSEGDVRLSFDQMDPTDLELTTWADQIDAAFDQTSKVGLLAYNTWHVAMGSHGLGVPGGDADLLGIVNWRKKGVVETNTGYFRLPGYLDGFETRLRKHVRKTDLSDGRLDGEWMGHGIYEKHEAPAWSDYLLDVLLTTMEREEFGKDEVPDFFFVNFKQTDMAGHAWTIDSEEYAQTLQTQDRALGDIIDFLDSEVGDYVVILTSDHGHTRSAEETGAWPIPQGIMRRDIQDHFGIPNEEELFSEGGAYGAYMDHDVAARYNVTAHKIARFLNGYTIADSWENGELPTGYEDRGGEHVFSAAFPTDMLPRIIKCAFDTKEPPDDAGP